VRCCNYALMRADPCEMMTSMSRGAGMLLAHTRPTSWLGLRGGCCVMMYSWWAGLSLVCHMSGTATVSVHAVGPAFTSLHTNTPFPVVNIVHAHQMQTIPGRSVVSPQPSQLRQREQ
jgi:hypothetical protein